MFGENTDGDNENINDINVNVDLNVNYEEDYDSDDEELEFVEVNVMVEQDQDGILTCALPDNHHRCASHTLNLVASEDSLAALTNPGYKRVSRRTCAKLQGVWNKQNRSSIYAEFVKDECGKMFKVPNATRWNSYYDAFQRFSEILSSKRDNLAGLFKKMNIPALVNTDVQFIHEFVKVSRF